MTISNNLKFKIVFFALFISCSYSFPSDDEIKSSDPGDFDTSNISVLGGDLSSGLSDAALHNKSQINSYSALFSQQVDAENFKQFDINSENGLNIFDFENTSSISGKYKLSFRNDTSPTVTQITTQGEQISSYEGQISEVNNLSIPQVKSYQFDDRMELDGNEYFNRLNIGTGKSLLDLSIESSPSFVILEMGISDIFEYARHGAVGNSNPDPLNINENDLTPTSVFQSSINNAINRLTNETTSDIVVFTIPDPTVFPYFNSLPWYFSPDEFLNLAFNHLTFYSSFNLDVQYHNGTVGNFNLFRPVIVFDVLGGETFKAKVIEDEYLVDATNEDGAMIPKYRQMTDDDLFLYSAEKLHFESMQTTTAFGTTTPIPDKYVITETEIEIINERKQEFNEIIEDLAENNDRVHLIDLNKITESVNNGEVIVDGITLNLSFDYNSIVSADGINFNAKGHALIANELIKLVNSQFNGSIEVLDINQFSGNEYQIDSN